MKKIKLLCMLMSLLLLFPILPLQAMAADAVTQTNIQQELTLPERADGPVIRNTLLSRLAGALLHFSETKVGAALHLPKWMASLCFKLDGSFYSTNRQMNRDLKRPSRYAIVDKYVLRDGKKHKCAIICPGGGYGMVCNFSEGVPIARMLNEYGISALIVYYRVGEQAAFPNPQDDLARAVREIHANKDKYNLDMEGYSVWGFSAGGHLVGSFGTTAMGYSKYDLPKPGLLVLSYPVISLESGITHMGTRNNLLGKSATAEQELAHSVHTNVDDRYPPTVVWCGNADTVVNPVNTTLMAQALEKNNIPYLCKIYEGIDHGVGTGKGTVCENWIPEAIAFWKSLSQ